MKSIKSHHWLLVVAVLAIGAGALIMKNVNTTANAQTGQFAAERPGTETGSNSNATLDFKPVPFDARNAMEHIREICRLGPRISGTPQHIKMVDMLERHFNKHGATVTKQTFSQRQKSQKENTQFVNLIASWNPSAKKRLLICTHYDTRPKAHEEPNPRDWDKPFLGANDGASGVAWMMEMARHMSGLKSNFGIDFVCFDGEEYIWTKQAEELGGDIYFIGSSYFAQEYAKNRARNQLNANEYVAAVLLDMIAGRNPSFPWEGHSSMRAGEVVKEIWDIAEKLGCPSFARVHGHTVRDDHVPLLNAGIKAIDIVPCGTANSDPFMMYPYWHRLDDTPANCYPEGMEQVAKVLSVWMQQKK